MINFREYPQLTKVVIPDAIQLSTSDFNNIFNNFNYYDEENWTSVYYLNDFTELNIGNEIQDKIINMGDMFSYCEKLTSVPICGDNVTDMSYTYNSCYNLTGSPVCGNKVTQFHHTYYECINLTGNPVCGPNVTTMAFTYFNCTNLYGNMYMYSPNVSNMWGCFANRNKQTMLNIYVLENSTSLNTCLNTNKYCNMVDAAISWTNDMEVNSRYYNTTHNIYIYPVSNVEQSRIDNGE